MKRLLIITGFIFITIFVVALIYFCSRQYEVTITQKQINDALQAKFPLTKSHLKIFRTTYSNPYVTLLPNSNRIEIGMDVDLEIKVGEEPKRFAGTAALTSELGYRQETKQFFIAKPEIKTLTINGVPQQYTDKISALVSDTAQKHLQQITVYTLKATDVKTTAAKLLLKNVQVKDTEIHVTLGL